MTKYYLRLDYSGFNYINMLRVPLYWQDWHHIKPQEELCFITPDDIIRLSQITSTATNNIVLDSRMHNESIIKARIKEILWIIQRIEEIAITKPEIWEDNWMEWYLENILYFWEALKEKYWNNICTGCLYWNLLCWDSNPRLEKINTMDFEWDDSIEAHLRKTLADLQLQKSETTH